MIIGEQGGQNPRVITPADVAGEKDFNRIIDTPAGDPGVLSFADLTDGLGLAGWGDVSGLFIASGKGKLTIDPSSDQEIGLEYYQGGNYSATFQRFGGQSISSSLSLTTFSFNPVYFSLDLSSFNDNTGNLTVQIYRTGTGGGVVESIGEHEIWIW